MKVKLGDFLFWKNKPAKIVGETSERQVIIEMLENKRCPKCDCDLGKDQANIIVSSPLFKENAKPIPSIEN